MLIAGSPVQVKDTIVFLLSEYESRDMGDARSFFGDGHSAKPWEPNHLSLTSGVHTEVGRAL
eukprot:167520-Chlamydomonas_euryale.AAC.1